ncbi:hypothetical protein C1B90_21345 [Salmonella enterica]|uniref:Uncharacterized protein n=1 Tax=Salmonella enterica TaxID=28901 RepID=A0A5T4LNB6_SALER|nr:hypothetical protein [Salmonella enterica]EBL7518584.1 hypothetical protein [Salmonella enterica]
MFGNMSSTGFASYYLPGWVNILSHDGPFTMSVRLAAWDSVNNLTYESERLKPFSSDYFVHLSLNVPEVKVPIDPSFSGKEIGYAYTVNTMMTAGNYFRIEDGMCHPSVPVGTQYTFIITPSFYTTVPIEIRDADGNVLWVASNSEAKHHPYVILGQIFYTEIADVSIDISPANINFGPVLFEEIKTVPITIKIQSNAVNTKINLEYEFIDDTGVANLKVDAAGIDGLSDTVTSSAAKNSPVSLTRNVSITNKNTTAGLYNGFLRITAIIP